MRLVIRYVSVIGKLLFCLFDFSLRQLFQCVFNCVCLIKCEMGLALESNIANIVSTLSVYMPRQGWSIS